MSYLTIPHVYPEQNARLSEIIQGAQSGEQHLFLLFGDSQESESGYIFWRSHVTAWADKFGGQLCGLWSRISSSNLMPYLAIGQSGQANTTANLANFIFGLGSGSGSDVPRLLPTNTGNGALYRLLWDSLFADTMFFGYGQRWHNTSGAYDRVNTRARVFGVDSTIDVDSTATQLNYGWFTNASPSGGWSWGAGGNTEGNVPCVAIPNAPGWWRAEIPGPNNWVDRYLRLMYRSGHASNRLVAQLTYIYRQGVGGVSVLHAGVGGAQSANLLATGSLSGPNLRAINPSIVGLGFATNDAYSGAVTAAQYKINTQANIDYIRTNLPDAVIVLLSDTYRRDDDNDATYLARRALHRDYVVKNKELCDENPNVIAINELRINNDLGWNEESENFNKALPPPTWAAGVAYAAGDIVKVATDQTWANNQGFSYWRCTMAHTSSLTSPASFPGSAGIPNHQQTYWAAVHRSMYDDVHQAPLAGYIRGQYVADFLWRVGTNALGSLRTSKGTAQSNNRRRYSTGSAIR